MITGLVNLPTLLSAQELPSNKRPLEYENVFKSSALARDLREKDPRLQFIEENDAPGRTLIWQSKDPNGDEVRYRVYLQSLKAGSKRVLIQTDIEESYLAFSTRGIEEGYYRFILEASDAAGRTDGEGKTSFRETDPFLIDTSPPSIEVVEIGASEIEIRVKDTWSVINSVSVKVNGGQSIELTPVDGFADEPEEVYSFKLDADESNEAGSLQIEAIDENGNSARLIY